MICRIGKISTKYAVLDGALPELKKNWAVGIPLKSKRLLKYLLEFKYMACFLQVKAFFMCLIKQHSVKNVGQ